MNERDIDILNNILKYCNQIDEANRQYDSSIENFEENSVYRNAVAMCVLQIGELAMILSISLDTIYSKNFSKF